MASCLVNFADNDDAIPAPNFGDMLNDGDWIIQQFTGMYADAEQTKEIYEGDFIDNTFIYKGKTITVRYLVTQSKFTRYVRKAPSFRAVMDSTNAKGVLFFSQPETI